VYSEIHYTRTELPWRSKTAKKNTKTTKDHFLGGLSAKQM